MKGIKSSILCTPNCHPLSMQAKTAIKFAFISYLPSLMHAEWVMSHFTPVSYGSNKNTIFTIITSSSILVGEII